MEIIRAIFPSKISVVPALFLCLAVSHAQAPPEWQPALDRISADSLRGHLSFIASDRLEGRDTPSPGLDIAAEYIAAQFRRIGLEPGGDDGYFQTADMRVIEQGLEGFELRLRNGEKTVTADKALVSISGGGPLELAEASVLKTDAAGLADLTAAQVKGRAVFLDESGYGRERYIRQLRALEPVLILLPGRGSAPYTPAPWRKIVDAATARGRAPEISVFDADVLNALRSGNAYKLSLRLPAASERPVKLRNVIGILRGSDPNLKDTCVLLTAHYDHIGVAREGTGDRIFNGANDDGSGTVSVVEIASALARLPQRPKRSIVFMTFFGEEEGGLGSQYYTSHPVFPLDRTLADVNLEQLGRTDSGNGPEISNATFTGFDYSDVAAIYEKAGGMTGVRVYKDPAGSDEYFTRSDNDTFARKGVPSTTVAVAFTYPDYHGLGDEWQKIDYANMAKVDRMLALGTLMMADSATVPHWNKDNSKAEPFRSVSGR